MIIQVDENISIEVCFDPADREAGFDDEIRFRIRDSGVKEMRLLEAHEVSFLIGVEQAEQLATGLQEAALSARSLPRLVFPGVPNPEVGF